MYAGDVRLGLGQRPPHAVQRLADDLKLTLNAGAQPCIGKLVAECAAIDGFRNHLRGGAGVM